MRNDLSRADADMCEYYTSALTLSGQSYEWGSSFDDDHDRGLVDDRYRRDLARIETIHVRLLDLEPAHAVVLRDVYHPYGLPDLRAYALQPEWGHGTFVRIAKRHPLAMDACETRHGERLSEHVSRYLADCAGAGDGASKFFEALRAACEELRTAALLEYRSRCGSARRQVAA